MPFNVPAHRYRYKPPSDNLLAAPGGLSTTNSVAILRQSVGFPPKQRLATRAGPSQLRHGASPSSRHGRISRGRAGRKMLEARGERRQNQIQRLGWWLEMSFWSLDMVGRAGSAPCFSLPQRDTRSSCGWRWAAGGTSRVTSTRASRSGSRQTADLIPTAAVYHSYRAIRGLSDLSHSVGRIWTLGCRGLGWRGLAVGVRWQGSVVTGKNWQAP